MPYLRSQFNKNKGNSKECMSVDMNGSQTVYERCAKPSKGQATAFPFPPTHIPQLSHVGPQLSNIIDVKNSSSDASFSDVSIASIPSKGIESPTSELPAKSDKSLNVAMLASSSESLSCSEETALSHADPLKLLLNSISAPVVTCEQTVSDPVIYLPFINQATVQEQKDRELQMVLLQYKCYEDDEGMNLRKRIVSEINMLVKQWIRSEGLKGLINWDQVEKIGGKVVSYGSFKLGVVDKESDLEICLAFLAEHHGQY